jgi:circadian clock protein KaiB
MSATRDEVRYELTLFVSGASDLSARAIANAKELCDTYLEGRYELAVVDVHEDASAALNSDVIAAPTLVRNWPLPVRKLVGDLSRIDRVLIALDLAAADDGPEVTAGTP